MLQAHPLTHLVIAGYANNEIRITRRSSSPVPKSWGDGAEEKRLARMSKRFEFINEIAGHLRRSNGDRIECPVIPCSPEFGIIHPISTSSSPLGIEYGVYRRADVAAFHCRLIEEDRVIRTGSPKIDPSVTQFLETLSRSPSPSPPTLPPPLDIPREFQEVTLMGENTPSIRSRIEVRFRDLALGFLSIRVREKSPALSRYARHTILEAGAVIEKHWGNHAVFTTCTIPGSTPAALETVAANSGWLMNRLYQKVRDLSKRKGIEIGWFFAWELQRRGALHPHIAIATKPDQMTRRQLLTFGQEMESHWFDLLYELKEKTGVDVFERGCKQGGTWRYNPEKWQSKSEMVTKSVAAYLSKYASKGAATKHQNDLDNLAVRGIYAPLPSRWWGCSRNILGLIKSWRFKHTIPVAWLQDPEIEKMLYSTLQGEYLELAQSENNVSYNGCEVKYSKVIERALGYRFAVVKNDKVIINGETEVYWYKPDVFAEIHGQIKAISEINYQAIPTQKSTSPKRVTGNSVLSLIADDNGSRQSQQREKFRNHIDKFKVVPDYPTHDLFSSRIVDLEQFCQYQEWQNMKDPGYRAETWRMIREEAEWSAKVWTLYLNDLRTLTKQNEYELRFGNPGPARELGLWEEVAAQTAIHEMMMAYMDETG